jgi:hypothetical protein
MCAHCAVFDLLDDLSDDSSTKTNLENTEINNPSDHQPVEPNIEETEPEEDSEVISEHAEKQNEAEEIVSNIIDTEIDKAVSDDNTKINDELLLKDINNEIPENNITDEDSVNEESLIGNTRSFDDFDETEKNSAGPPELLNGSDHESEDLKAEISRLRKLLEEANEKEAMKIPDMKKVKERYSSYVDKLKSIIGEVNHQLLIKERELKQSQIRIEELECQSQLSDKDKEVKKLNGELQLSKKAKVDIEENLRVAIARNERSNSKIETLEKTVEAVQELLQLQKSSTPANMIRSYTPEVEIIIKENEEPSTTGAPSTNKTDKNSENNSGCGTKTINHNDRDIDLRNQDRNDPRDIDMRPGSIDYQPDQRPFCHFWNNRGSCRYSERYCKFRHEESPYCELGQNCKTFRCQFYHETAPFLSHSHQNRHPPYQSAAMYQHQEYKYREQDYPQLHPPQRHL